MTVRKPRNPNIDAGLLIKDAAKLLPDPARRLFLRNTASLGALVLLTGCDIVDGPTSERALRVVSQFNDWVQARLFNPDRLAETFPESAITKPFPFNAYYSEQEAPDVDEGNDPARFTGIGTHVVNGSSVPEDCRGSETSPLQSIG